MRAAEEERFRALAAASMPWLTRTATALAGDAHRGDDLVQEALVRAYVHWRKVRAADDPRAYLRRILVRCHLDAARSPRRREVATGGPDDVAASTRAASGHDPHRQVEDRLPLLDALRGLTDRQRAVVVLRFLEDVDVAGTAEALGISAGTVKSTTHDALRLLRGRLDDADGGPACRRPKRTKGGGRR
ncbi:SigE family RNA polymerase sigma factor [Thalassiella azotivora]